jgi:hypothetical protein
MGKEDAHPLLLRKRLRAMMKMDKRRCIPIPAPYCKKHETEPTAASYFDSSYGFMKGESVRIGDRRRLRPENEGGKEALLSVA